MACDSRVRSGPSPGRSVTIAMIARTSANADTRRDRSLRRLNSSGITRSLAATCATPCGSTSTALMVAGDSQSSGDRTVTVCGSVDPEAGVAASTGWRLATVSRHPVSRRQSQTDAISRTWVSRRLLPDGSRKPESMPYGRAGGTKATRAGSQRSTQVSNIEAFSWCLYRPRSSLRRHRRPRLCRKAGV